MPRPSSKIMSVPATENAAASGESNNAAVAGVIADNMPRDADSPAKTTNRPKKLKALGALSPADAKARRKELITALKTSAEPLDASTKVLNDLGKKRAATQKEFDKAVAALTKEHDKAQKGIAKEEAAAAKVHAKHAKAHETGKAKIEEQLAALQNGQAV